MATGEAICLPGSKSMAARALVIKRMLGSATRLEGMPDCNDTRELTAAMNRLAEWERARKHQGEEGSEAKEGEGGLPGDTEGVVEFDMGEGGTSLRFFLAVAASTPGLPARIDCAEGLRRRPLKPLVDVLRRAGAEISYLGEEGKAPVMVRGKRLDGAGIEETEEFRAAAKVSSQFVSALMMASLGWEHRVDGDKVEGVSRPYIEMTARMMERLEQRPEVYRIEPDWSASSYFYEYELITGRKVRFEGDPDPAESLQGDARIAGITAFVMLEMPDGWRVVPGALNGVAIELSMNETPDLVPALAAGLCFSGTEFRLVDVGHLRVKETDRIAAVCGELAKAGFELGVGDVQLENPRRESVYMEWKGTRNGNGEEPRAGRTYIYDSHNDHRMAMAMAMTAVAGGEVVIEGAEAVRKSFPGYYDEIRKLGIVEI